MGTVRPHSHTEAPSAGDQSHASCRCRCGRTSAQVSLDEREIVRVADDHVVSECIDDGRCNIALSIGARCRPQ